MASNVTVVIRVRPLLKDESSSAVSVTSQTSLLLHPLSKKKPPSLFAFDRVFDEFATQQQIHENTCATLVDGLLDGYNATVFAYGATGCGKTHTITGTNSDPGLITRTLLDLYARKTPSTQITLSFLEVYNETVRDLIMVSNRVLGLREDDVAKKVHVSGVSEHSCEHVHEVLALLDKGNSNRVKAPTAANEVSSRSHAVLMVHVKVSGLSSQKWATLNIIDLAGSERASVTKNQGDRLLEGANINRSLLALGNCINALCSEKPVHIPYRDSKLTRLLKYSLSGNCKVIMISNISPFIGHYEETRNTLKYADRAKNIKTSMDQNIQSEASPFVLIQNLQSQIKNLESQLQIQSKNNGHSNEDANHSLEFDIISTKVSKIYKKIEGKTVLKTSATKALTRNESILKISEILIDIPSCTPQLKILSQKLSVLNESLHVTNVTLRHNLSEFQSSIDRYHKRLSAIVNSIKSEPLLLRITEYSENSKRDVQLIELGLIIDVYKDLSNVDTKCIKSLASVICNLVQNVNYDSSLIKLLEGLGMKCDDLNLEKFEERDDLVCDVSVAYDSASETESDIGDFSFGILPDITDNSDFDTKDIDALFDDSNLILNQLNFCNSKSLPLVETKNIQNTPLKTTRKVTSNPASEFDDEMTPVAKQRRNDEFTPAKFSLNATESPKKIQKTQTPVKPPKPTLLAGALNSETSSVKKSKIPVRIPQTPSNRSITLPIRLNSAQSFPATSRTINRSLRFQNIPCRVYETRSFAKSSTHEMQAMASDLKPRSARKGTVNTESSLGLKKRHGRYKGQ